MGLDGVRVLDLSTGIAGAYCTKLLADAGAEVTEVEPPESDPLRRWSASGSAGSDGHEDGALFRYLRPRDQRIALDLSNGDGAAEASRLARGADLVVESFPPGYIESVGLGFAELSRASPSTSLVSISAFGRGGEGSAEQAPEFLLQARSGSIWGHGLSGREPVAVGGRLGEWSAGAYAALGAMTAYTGSRKTGRGSHVDVSVLETLALTLVPYPSLSASFPGGQSRRTVGALFPSIEPCSDGYVGLFVLTAQQWATLFTMIGRADLAEDSSLATMAGRAARRKEIVEALRSWTSQRTVAEVVECGALFRLPATEVGNGQTLPAMEHLIARELFGPSPRGGFLQPRPPFRSCRRQAGPPLPATRERDGALPLSGVKVLDLTAFWAGPYATLYLASAGADVLKVESVQRPDPIRFNVFLPPTADKWYEQGFLYNAANLGKRSVTLNLADADGRALLLRLAARCDVVIENFTPRVMDQFGLGYEEFAAVRSDVIMLRMPAFGLDGPSRDRPGFAPTMEQAAGMAWMTGYEDQPPIVPGGMCDPLAGVHAAYAILVALEHRRRTGEGQHIEMAMIDVAANVTAEQVIEWSAYGQLLGRQANRGPLAAPQGVYGCAGEEQWVAVAVANDAEWRALVAALGDPAWAMDPELASEQGRRRLHDLVDAEMSAWCATRARDEVLSVLRRAGVPAQPVVPAPQIDRDPQMLARGFWQEVGHPVAGTHLYPSWPFRLTPPLDAGWYRCHAPLLGQHTEEVLTAELGLDEAELARLRDAKVIGTRPVGA